VSRWYRPSQDDQDRGCCPAADPGILQRDPATLFGARHRAFPWPGSPITREQAERLLLLLLLEVRDAEGLAGVLGALIAWSRAQNRRRPWSVA
jgi:hypothetical protein